MSELALALQTNKPIGTYAALAREAESAGFDVVTTFNDLWFQPALPALLEILFGGAGVKAPTNFPRTDLVAAFLTGVQGLNQPANVTPSVIRKVSAAAPPVSDSKPLNVRPPTVPPSAEVIVQVLARLPPIRVSVPSAPLT